MSRRALLIVTSHDRLGETGRPTGLYLSEVAHPHDVLARAGFQIDVASPRGGKAPIDPKSLTSELDSYVRMVDDTRPLASIDVRGYDAFLVAGGHGTMWDLPASPELQRILPAALEQGKPVAAVCHGPAALVGLTRADGAPLVAGKRLTAFTDEEEAAVGLTEVMPFLLESRLRGEGARFAGAPMWQSNVIEDGLLVTGQNPASARGVAEAVVRLLLRSEGRAERAE